MMEHKKKIEIDGNELIFENLSDPKVVSEFIDIINKAKNKEKFVLNFKRISRNQEAVYPNVCVPIAGIIEHATVSQGIEFEFYYLSYSNNNYLENIGIKKAFKVTDNKEFLLKSSLDKIWRFESENDIFLLGEAFTQELSEKAECEKGVLRSFEWAINEVLDNVLKHSGKEFGYVMGQAHKEKFVFCVYDTGKGIYHSLLDSQDLEHKPKNPTEAIKIALQEGVTRDKRVGQGNGLWGLSQIVKANKGMLNIVSSTALYRWDGKNDKSFTVPTLSNDPACLVYFQINSGQEISLPEALGGYNPVDLRIENLEDVSGNIVIDLKTKTTGLGTRRSGEKIRNEVINLYKETKKRRFKIT